MIVDPEGNRRVPSPLELLEKIKNERRQREQRSLQPDDNYLETSNGANRAISEQSRYVSDTTDGTSQSSDRSDQAIERTGRSPNDRAYTDGSNNIPPGGSSSSPNQYNQRSTTESTRPTIPVELLPKSKFRPFDQYRRVIKEAFDDKQKADKSKARGKTLSEAEIKLNYSKLVEVILWQSEHMDEFIIATTKGHDKTILIWGDIDKDDASVLADYLMEEGRQHAQVAQAVRSMIALRSKIQAGLIMLPRAYKMMILYFERGFSIR